MHELNVAGLPAEDQVARVKDVVKFIGSLVLTHYRNTIKAKIQSSTENEDTRNIANLTHVLIAKTPVQPTLQHYIRFAFLRWIAKEYKDTPEDQWWVQVDNSLEMLRKNCKTEVELSQAFIDNYNDDKAAYGDPADTPHRVIMPNNVTPFLHTIGSYARKVQGKTVVKGKGKKRPRVEDENASESEKENE